MVSLRRALMKLFMPGMVEDLDRDGYFQVAQNLRDGRDESLDLHLSCEDRGSDITVISFSGMAMLYGGIPRFEFGKMLSRGRRQYNLLFVRDIYRCMYRRSPLGQPDGLTFYKQIVHKALVKLSSRYNVAIGFSGGGEVAFALSDALPLHKIIAFNPTVPHELYSQENLWTLVRLIPAFFREPGGIMTSLGAFIGAPILQRRINNIVGKNGFPNVMETYVNTKPSPPPAMIFYSERNIPARKVAQRFKDIPSVTLHPVPTVNHNCLNSLSRRQQMTALLHDEIERAYTVWEETGRLT